MNSITSKEAWDLEPGDVIRCQEDNCTRQVQSTFKTDDQVHVEYTDGFASIPSTDSRKTTMTRKLLMNLQGMTFTEQQARDYYGSRFEIAELVWVTVDEDGQVVEGKSDDCA